MNWFTGAWHAVTHPGQLIRDGEHLLGQVTDQGAHLVGRGLTDIGLGQLGNTVDGWGDDAGNSLDPELQLGQTTDPTQLIHGDPGAIRKTASQLHTFSGAFGQTASGLTGIDTSHWTGTAADAFQEKYAPQPGKWRDASTASGNAGGALGSYADTVDWAQGQAREAIAIYAQGQKVSQAAVSAYSTQVNAYNAAAQQYDAKLSAGQNPGIPPTKPAAFSDPGASLREHAQEILTEARAQRDSAGSAAASAVSKATDMAPASPGLWSQVGDTLSDWNQSEGLAKESFAAGVVTGVADIGKFARSVNPQDRWNMQHPAEYLAGLSGTDAGLVHDGVHPQDLVGQMLGSGWGSDPAMAAGKLVPQVALALATDGGGAAADAGTDAGVDAGTAAAKGAGDTGASGGSDLRGSADNPDATQPTGKMDTAADPVDVATGNVIFGQTDVRLDAALPVVVRRMHRSGYRAGRWFGRRWASTLDQRLEVTPEGVFVGDDDGVILTYPHPSSEPVLPMAGALWPLARDGDGYTVTDPQAGIVRGFQPRSGFYLSAEGYGELPLVSVTDRAGHQIRFDYGPDGAPQTITHDGGYQVKVLMTGNRIAALALADARASGQDVPLVFYRYDQAGNLSEVVNSSGQPLRLFYDDEARLTGWEDRNGFTYRYCYDDQGRCVHGEGPDGTLSATFAYDPDNLLTTCTDATGAVTLYEITPRCKVAAVTDPSGNVTRSEYDAYGRLVARTDPLGRTTRWTYDDHGNLIAITRPDGSQATAVYDEQNLPVTITEPGGAAWRQDYDGAGNLVRQQAPDGAVTSYTWDKRGYLASVTDPLGATTRVECDGAGMPITVIGPDGAGTRYERDTFGRVTAMTAPDGAVTQLAWTLEGRLACRIFPDGTAEQLSYDSEGNLSEHLNPAGGLTRFEYGCFDHITARIVPDGTRTEFGYNHDLRLTSVTISGSSGPPSAARLTWLYDYDPAGRLVGETDYNGTTTRYAHDAAGQLTHQFNASGQQVGYIYDLQGNITERHADDRVTLFNYDSASRLVRASNSRAEITIEYDPAGRVTAEACNGRAVLSAYDAVGRLVRRVTPSGAESRWAYDAAGRPTALDTAGQELRFGYDQSGRETTRQLPGGTHLAQEWDIAGRLAAQILTAGPRLGISDVSPVLTQPSAGATTTTGGTVPSATGRMLQRRDYSYRVDNVPIALADLLSGPRRLTVDAIGRVTGVEGPDWAERYAYDPIGNITAAIWPTPPGLAGAWAGISAQGPRQYQGTRITRAGDVRYEYDACGRITLRQRTRDSRKPDSWRYQWDADDHLTAVITPDGTTWRYLYDPLGRRIAKQRLTTEDQVTEHTSFTWDGPVLAEQTVTPAGQPATVLDSATDGLIITWNYQPGTFTPVTQITGPARASCDRAPQDQVDSQFYAIVTDLIGAPAELITPDGELGGYQQRTLWGTTLWHPDGASTPLRFPGQYADDETGLHYNHHRYYDPVTGSYLTPDPLGLGPSPNPHAYVHNPTIRVDPLGLMDPCDQEAYDYATTPTKLDHIFAAKHNFGPLVQQFGSREAVVKEMLGSLKGRTPQSGVFQETVTIGGQQVVIRGAVVKGVVKLGTAFTP